MFDWRDDLKFGLENFEEKKIKSRNYTINLKIQVKNRYFLSI